jgi:hypothetical protein
MGSIPFHLIGFSSEDAAKSAVSLVDKVIFDVSQQLGLNIGSLDGVTIAYDYRAALAGLDRGFQSNNPLTPSSDAVADGIAMAPLVRRDSLIMSHIVLNASMLPTIAADLRDRWPVYDRPRTRARPRALLPGSGSPEYPIAALG